MSNRTLEQIRLSILSGDNQFLAEQYHLHKKYCVEFLSSRKHCLPTEAEDVFTESILVLRRNILANKLTHQQNIKSYLLSIAINLCKDQKRKKIRIAKKTEQVRLLFYEKNHNISKTYDEDTEDVIRICRMSLRSMSPKCEQILRLFYIEGMKMKDIAELTGLANANVAKSSKSRCYNKWMEAALQLLKRRKNV